MFINNLYLEQIAEQIYKTLIIHTFILEILKMSSKLPEILTN